MSYLSRMHVCMMHGHRYISTCIVYVYCALPESRSCEDYGWRRPVFEGSGVEMQGHLTPKPQTQKPCTKTFRSGEL